MDWKKLEKTAGVNFQDPEPYIFWTLCDGFISQGLALLESPLSLEDREALRDIKIAAGKLADAISSANTATQGRLAVANDPGAKHIIRSSRIPNYMFGHTPQAYPRNPEQLVSPFKILEWAKAADKVLAEWPARKQGERHSSMNNALMSELEELLQSAAMRLPSGQKANFSKFFTATFHLLPIEARRRLVRPEAALKAYQRYKGDKKS